MQGRISFRFLSFSSLRRSNPIAFQAIRFQPRCCTMRGWTVTGKARTRCSMLSITSCGCNKVSIQGTGRENSRACARSDPSSLCHKGRSDHPGSGVTGSHPHAGVGAAGSIAVEADAACQRPVIEEIAGRVSGVAKALLGATSVGAWVFLRDGGRGRRKTVRECIRESKVGRRGRRVQDHSAHRALSRL